MKDHRIGVEMSVKEKQNNFGVHRYRDCPEGLVRWVANCGVPRRE